MNTSAKHTFKHEQVQGFIMSSLRTLQSATDPAAKVVELYEADMLNLSVQQHETAVILRGISR